MSNYANFVKDFPRRCAGLLKRSNRPGEVTLMLCVAMPGIIVPLERLKGPSEHPEKGWLPGHPAGDWNKFEKAKSDLDQLFKQRFRGSRLWPNADSTAWSFGPLTDVSRAPDFGGQLDEPMPLAKKEKVKGVLTHMRNALAHGNVFTRGNPEIEQIILVSRKSENSNSFNFLAVSPEDFRTFLDNWFDFLEEIKLPEDVVSERAGAVAWEAAIFEGVAL